MKGQVKSPKVYLRDSGRTSPQSQIRNQSAPSQADHAGAEFAGEVELQGFAFEACRDAMLGRPSLVDFPAVFGERYLHRFRKRFAEGVGDEKGAFAVFRSALL
jgi:hypothetical protein